MRTLSAVLVAAVIILSGCGSDPAPVATPRPTKRPPGTGQAAEETTTTTVEEPTTTAPETTTTEPEATTTTTLEP